MGIHPWAWMTLSTLMGSRKFWDRKILKRGRRSLWISKFRTLSIPRRWRIPSQSFYRQVWSSRSITLKPRWLARWTRSLWKCGRRRSKSLIKKLKKRQKNWKIKFNQAMERKFQLLKLLLRCSRKSKLSRILERTSSRQGLPQKVLQRRSVSWSWIKLRTKNQKHLVSLLGASELTRLARTNLSRHRLRLRRRNLNLRFLHYSARSLSRNLKRSKSQSKRVCSPSQKSSLLFRSRKLLHWTS